MKFRLLLLTAALFTFGSLTSAIAQTGAPGSQPTPAPTPGTVPSGDPGVFKRRTTAKTAPQPKAHKRLPVQPADPTK